MTPFSITTKRNHHDIIYSTSGLKGNIIWYVDLLGHNNNYFLTIIYKGFISPFDEKVMAYYFRHNFGLFLWWLVKNRRQISKKIQFTVYDSMHCWSIKGAGHSQGVTKCVDVTLVDIGWDEKYWQYQSLSIPGTHLQNRKGFIRTKWKFGKHNY